MKQFAKNTLIVITCALFSYAALADDKADIKAAINELPEAYKNADAEAMERLLATPYSHINNGGEPVERSKYIGWQSTRIKQIADGTSKVTKYESSDLVIDVFNPNTAVVTGFAILAGVRGGKEWDLDLRFTNLWLKNETGQWQRAAFHDTYMKK